MHNNGDYRTCSSEDLIADRKTHTHTQTDTLIAILRSPAEGRRNYAVHTVRYCEQTARTIIVFPKCLRARYTSVYSVEYSLLDRDDIAQ